MNSSRKVPADSLRTLDLIRITDPVTRRSGQHCVIRIHRTGSGKDSKIILITEAPDEALVRSEFSPNQEVPLTGRMRASSSW